MGPPAQGLTAAGLETPFPRFPPAPKSTRDRWGEGGDAQRHLPLSLQASTPRRPTRAPPDKAGQPAPAAPAAPQPRSRHGLQARVSLAPRPPVPSGWLRRRGGRRDKAARARPEALSGPGSRTGVRPGTRPRRSRPGKELLLNGAPRPAAPGAATAAAQRRCAPTRPDFRGAAPGRGAARSSPSARRAHTGARPRTLTHTRCTLTASRPHPCAKEPRAPRTGQGPHPVHQTPAPARASRDLLAEAGGPGGRPSRRPARPAGRGPRHREVSVRPAPTPGGEEGAAPRLELARGVGDRGTPITTTTTHPSPPFLQHKRLQTEPPSPCYLPGARSSSTSAAPGAAEPETRAGKAPGCGAEIRAEAACRASGVPLGSHRPQRQQPPGAGPAPPPPAFPPSPGCRGAARELSPPPARRTPGGGRAAGERR